MISKGETRKEKSKTLAESGSAWPGILLVTAGVLLLAINLFQIRLPGEVWPFYIAGFGVLLLLPASQLGSEKPGAWESALAVIGAVVVMIGLLTAFAETVDHYESWAYAWILLPAAGVAGRMYADRHNPDSLVHRSGRRTIQLLLLAFVGLAVYFEMFIFNGYGRWWPVLLIAVGIFLLLNSRR